MVASCMLLEKSSAWDSAAWRVAWLCHMITPVQTTSKATAMVVKSWIQIFCFVVLKIYSRRGFIEPHCQSTESKKVFCCFVLAQLNLHFWFIPGFFCGTTNREIGK